MLENIDVFCGPSFNGHFTLPTNIDMFNKGENFRFGNIEAYGFLLCTLCKCRVVEFYISGIPGVRSFVRESICRFLGSHLRCVCLGRPWCGIRSWRHSPWWCGRFLGNGWYRYRHCRKRGDIFLARVWYPSPRSLRVRFWRACARCQGRRHWYRVLRGSRVR